MTVDQICIDVKMELDLDPTQYLDLHPPDPPLDPKFSGIQIATQIHFADPDPPNFDSKTAVLDLPKVQP